MISQSWLYNHDRLYISLSLIDYSESLLESLMIDYNYNDCTICTHVNVQVHIWPWVKTYSTIFGWLFTSIYHPIYFDVHELGAVWFWPMAIWKRYDDVYIMMMYVYIMYIYVHIYIYIYTSILIYIYILSRLWLSLLRFKVSLAEMMVGWWYLANMLSMGIPGS